VGDLVAEGKRDEENERWAALKKIVELIIGKSSS
jgi:hypothetical protein